MSREEAIEILKQFKRCLSDVVFDEKGSEAWQMAISELEHHDEFMKRSYEQGKKDALEQMPEVTSTMQTGQFDYVPIRETKGISCSECRFFKVTQQPLRGTGGLIDLGQAKCEKHDLIKDFAHHGQFKNLKPCEYYEDFKEGDKG